MEYVEIEVLTPGQEIYFAKVEFLFADSADGVCSVISGPFSIFEVSSEGEIVDTHGNVNYASIMYNTVVGYLPASQCFSSLTDAERYIEKTVNDRQKELEQNEREKVVVA